MNKKVAFYHRYGIEEYYLYDPERNELEGWQIIEGILEVIEPMEGWVSPRLRVRFELPESGLEIYRPDGERFLSYSETNAERLLERRRAEQEFQRAEQESQRAEQESLKAQQAAQRSELLAAKLRELNIDPDSI